MNQFPHSHNAAPGLEVSACVYLCVIELRSVCDFVLSAKWLEVYYKKTPSTNTPQPPFHIIRFYTSDYRCAPCKNNFMMHIIFTSSY